MEGNKMTQVYPHRSAVVGSKGYHIAHPYDPSLSCPTEGYTDTCPWYKTTYPTNDGVNDRSHSPIEGY